MMLTLIGSKKSNSCSGVTRALPAEGGAWIDEGRGLTRGERLVEVGGRR